LSRKANRLRNRLRIERERSAKESKRIAATERHLAQERRAIDVAQKDLNRSVALRMRVSRDFERPIGPAFCLNIVIYPNEFRLMRLSDRPYDATHFAAMRGHEAGHKIAEVIERCLTGELEAFQRASSS
jgi:hypothetical protein